MKNKATALMIVALCGLLSACNIGGKGSKNSSNSEQGSESESGSQIHDDEVYGSPYSQLNGRKVKKVYETLTTSSIASLNYLQTSAAQNARYFTNFVDGLLTHSEFGSLELNIAKSASHNEDYTEFTFKLKEDENIVWITYEGKPYKYDGETQYVKAEDFVQGAKTVCTMSNGADTYYLLTDFLDGALEYYLYTQIQYGKIQGMSEFTKLNTDAKMANWINKAIKNEHDNVYHAGGYDENPIEAEDIPLIAAGKRFGVTANEENNEVTYRLMSPAMYFPTLLTYSCYLPVNPYFYETKGSSFGTSARDSILYNGPYYLEQLDETNIVFAKNTYYAAQKGLRNYQQVHVDKVKYNIVKTDIDASYTRSQFESGNIDGFSLSPNDSEGWDKYVIGPNGEGTLENPYDGLVNSRLLDTIGYAYGTNIVLERTKNPNSKTTYSSLGSVEQIANTEKALRLLDVRKALMASFDYPEYFQRYAEGDKDSILARQMLVHTYVPRNFVYDSNGNEYTQTYYAQALADKRGISLEDAQEVLTPGTWEHRQKDQSAVSEAVAKAQAAISAYNASDLATKYGTINYPIQIEYFSMWHDQTTKTYDTLMIDALNRRLNGISKVEANYANCTIFKVVPTDLVTDANYSKADGQSTGAAAFDFSAHMWGWGADYGDPLTYLNTYTKNGDWGSIFNFINVDYVPNITVDGDEVAESDLLAHYTEMVKTGQQEYQNLAKRYAAFAEAEVELIEGLAIYMPQTNDGQGWALSISKAAGYESPTSNYGLSSDRLTGLWVLQEPLTSVERKAIREQFEINKAAYLDSLDKKESYPIYN